MLTALKYIARNKGRSRYAWPNAEERAALHKHYRGERKRLDTSCASYAHKHTKAKARRLRQMGART